MPINGGLSNSSSSSSSRSSTPRTLEESMGRLRIQKYDHNREPDCKIFSRTRDCPHGVRCRFKHRTYAEKEQGVLYLGGPQRFGEPDCEFYLKTGICKFGPACRYHHPRDRYGAGPLQFNSLDLPIRQGEVSCTFYLRNGYCDYGVTCRYNHPEPATTRTNPDNGHGPTSSPSAPAASHNSDHRSQSLETSSMQLAISPSQGLAPAYGWNSYLGYTNPISYASVHGTAAMYNPYTGALIFTNLVNLMIPATSFTHHLPERPDQPECWDFMRYGICKYGPDCKYHHPRERKVQMDTYLLGLPIKSDQAFSSAYDHPLVGTYLYSNCRSFGGIGQEQPFQFQNSSPSFHILEA